MLVGHPGVGQVGQGVGAALFGGAGVVAALRRLAGDRAQAAALGAAGRRRVDDVFSVSAMVRQAQAIYEEAITISRR